VLGPLMENRLFLSTDNYGWAWLGRKGVLILGAITLFGIFYPPLKEKFKKNRESSLGGGATRSGEESNGNGRIHWGSATFVAVVVVTLAWALWQSRDFGYRAGLFPWAIGYPLFTLCIVQLVLTLTGKERKAHVATLGDFETAAEPELPREIVTKRTKTISFWIITYYLAIWLLGFSYAFPLMIFGYLKFGAGEKWPISLILTAAGWGFFYLLFDYSLQIPFPLGLVFEWWQ
jgi:hypothetical protein